MDAFKLYLEHLGLKDTDFFKFTKPELDKHLATFWWNACTQKGKKYKANSLDTLRHELKRAINAYGHEFDITDKKCMSFTKSQKAFETAKKDLKQSGKGHAEIAPAGKKSILFWYSYIDTHMKECHKNLKHF